MSSLKQLRAKQKRKAEEVAHRRGARISKKVARTADSADGLNDLPIEVSLAMEASPAQKPTESAAVQKDDSVANLVSRLEAIKERIFRLRAVFAVSLSRDCAMEANRYLTLFQNLAQKLKTKDALAYENLVRGHEQTLLVPPIPVTQTIPIETQKWCEMAWEARQSPLQRAPKRPTIPDGLDWLVG